MTPRSSIFDHLRTLVGVAEQAKTIIDALHEQGLHRELPQAARDAIAHVQGIDLTQYYQSGGGVAPPEAPHLPDGGGVL